MTFPAARLTDQANLQTSTTEGSNAWGTTGTPVYTQINCLFGQPKGTYSITESGDRLKKTPVCIVPAGTAAKEGNLLVGLTAPFNKTYRIKQVNPARLPSSISHLELELEAVE